MAGVRIVGEDEVERARALDAKAKDIADTFATALAPIQRDISNAVLDTYQAFLSVESVIARVVQIAANLYQTVSGRGRQGARTRRFHPRDRQDPHRRQPAHLLPGGRARHRARRSGAAGAAGAPDRPGPPQGPGPLGRPAVAARAEGRGGGSEGESLDAVETLIKQLDKARDTAKAELGTVGKTKCRAGAGVALPRPRPRPGGRKRGKRADPALDADERARVLSAAEAMQRYRDATENAQQALRQSAEAARFFAQAASDGLAEAIVNGKSFGSVLTDLTKQPSARCSAAS